MRQQPDWMRPCWRWSILTALLILGICVGLSAGTAQAGTPVDAGYRTFSYASGSSSACNSTPTGEKPESKLWYNDGFWWGSLCHAPSKTYHIYQFDLANHDWIDTGTEIDNRGGTKADVLWDEAAQKLYVASAVFTNSGAAHGSSSNWARLYRYSYNAGNKRYTLDSGFPVTVSKGRAETITLTKDSTGTLWVTYVEDRKVMLNRSQNGNDASWVGPYALPGASTVNSDDISSMISFGDRVGVMWSNQTAKIMYFAVRLADDTNDNWTIVSAYNPGGSGADDHINLKALQNDSAGVVFAATKTSLSSSQPLINLLVCTTFPCNSASHWQAHQVYTGKDDDTRPVVQIDPNARKVHIFTANTGSAGEIAYKATSLDNIQFSSGNGELIIKNSGDNKINNPTSTKQHVSSATGVLVAASSQTTFYYYHYYNNLTGGPPPTPPVITSFSPTSGMVGSEVIISGSRFTGANAVSFNGTAATYVVNSDSQIRATVPAGATSGPIRVTTPQGSAVSSSNFTVTPPPNAAPTVNAGADQAVTLPNSAALAATVNDDGLPNPPGAVTLQWSKVSGPGDVTFGSATSATTTATFSAPGSYVLRLTANDSALSASDDLTVTVAPPPNQPPTVNAGADQGINLPASAALVATVSDDGLPTPPGAVTLQWSKVSGPGDVTFGSPNAAATSANFSASGVYVLRLTANDSALSTSDDVTVTVNAAPTVNAGADQAVTLPNSAALAATVNDDGLPNPPGAVTLQWSKVSGPGNVTFGSATSATTTATFSAPGVYVLRLTANDSALSASDDLTVTVQPEIVNQPPTVNAGPDQAITSPASAALAATVNDDGLPTPPGALTLEWSKVSGPGDVTFDSPNTAATNAGFSTTGSYVLRLTVSDSVLSASDDLTVVVSPASPSNQPPSVDAGADQAVTLANGAALAALVGDDGLPNPPGVLTLEWSKVSGPGDVNFDSPNTAATNASFSATGVYVLRLTASDGALSASDDLTVTVDPESVNQPPTVNVGADQAVTLPASAALAALVGDDGLPTPPNAVTLQWSKVSGPGDVTFGSATSATTTATFSAPGIYVLRLTASDSVLSASDDVSVVVSPAGPPPPVITSFSPASGPVGSDVVISGSGFTGATAVSFDSSAAAVYVVESDSQIRATVPAGATSGPIHVTTPQGSAVSSGNFTVTPPPDAGDIIYVSLAASANVAGISVRDEDILVFDTVTETWMLYFDGSDVGLSSSDVNAFDMRPDGSILMVFNTVVDVGLDRPATPIDIVRFRAQQFGPNTSGTFEWFFQGGAVGLQNTTEQVIDALAVTPEGHLILSLAGSYNLPGVNAGRDEDLIRFTPSQPGVYSSGTFSLEFDGSDVGLSDSGDEDVVGVWLDPDSDDIYLTAKGKYSVAGSSGDGIDIFICTPGPFSTGSTTDCAFRTYDWIDSELRKEHGLAGESIDAFSIDKGGLSRNLLVEVMQAEDPAEPQPDEVEEDDGWPDTDNWVSFPYLQNPQSQQ